MKKVIQVLFWAAVLSFSACQKESRTNVTALVTTELGNIKIQLFDDTPIHRDNFIKQVESGAFNGASFFKFMPGYMVMAGLGQQAASPDGKIEGMEENLNPLTPEIGKFHYRGAVAAPRVANANRSSDGDNFYIVTGRSDISDAYLDRQQQQFKFEYSPSARENYKKYGGYPFLDGDHTVFGEVIEGLEVADKLLKERGGKNNIEISIEILD